MEFSVQKVLQFFISFFLLFWFCVCLGFGLFLGFGHFKAVY